MTSLKWQQGYGWQLNSHRYESKDTAGRTGTYPLLLLHSFSHSVIKGSLDNSTDWKKQLVRHENILNVTTGQALCLKNPYVPHQSKLGLENFNSFLCWQADILTLFFGSCLSGHMTVFKRIITIWYLRFFLFLSRLVLTAHSEVRGMQRDVSQAIPTPFSCPDTSLCAYWENGVNPSPAHPHSVQRLRRWKVYLALAVPGLFPCGHKGK